MPMRRHVFHVAFLEGKAASPGGARRTRAYVADGARITEIARLANRDAMPTPLPRHRRPATERTHHV